MSSLMEEPSVVGEAPIQQNNSLPSVPLVPTNDRVDITEPGTDYFGEQLKDKKQGVLRIGFININSLSKHKATAKYDSIRSSLAAGEIDIIGLAETNKCWHLMESENTWKEVSKTWWKDSHSSISYKTHFFGKITTFCVAVFIFFWHKKRAKYTYFEISSLNYHLIYV